MEQTEITAAIRRAIGEIQARSVSDAIITAVTLRAVTLLGLKIKEKDPTFFNKRSVGVSFSNVFDMPSDCKQISNIWDYNDYACTVSGAAANSSGEIRITAGYAFPIWFNRVSTLTHPYADEAVVTIYGVTGCTEANGTWKINYVDGSNFDLLGSTFTNAYVSGGTVFEEKTDMTEITKINMSEQTGRNSYKWYPRGDQIVVDDTSYDSDIIIDYESYPTTIAEIPSEYHEFLISWPVVNLLSLPARTDKDYADRRAALDLHLAIIQMVQNDIERTFKTSSAPTFIRNAWTS